MSRAVNGAAHRDCFFVWVSFTVTPNEFVLEMHHLYFNTTIDALLVNSHLFDQLEGCRPVKSVDGRIQHKH